MLQNGQKLRGGGVESDVLNLVMPIMISSHLRIYSMLGKSFFVERKIEKTF